MPHILAESELNMKAQGILLVLTVLLRELQRVAKVPDRDSNVSMSG